MTIALGVLLLISSIINIVFAVSLKSAEDYAFEKTKKWMELNEEAQQLRFLLKELNER